MIEKISKLKKFGIFRDFIWSAELEAFKKFNLIYSWNRSGKTTVSRVFSSCEKRSTYDAEKFKQYPEGGEFEIKVTNDGLIKSANISHCLLPIKVFNQDFIDDNISFDPLNLSNPIVYVGEEDVERKKQLDKLKQEKSNLSSKLELAQEQKNTKEGVKNTFLIGLGREIAGFLFDKTYNKTKVENKINKIDLENVDDKILSDEDKKNLEETSKSDAKKN
jgi:wobble nucleotide-excising tRNase